MPMRIKWVKKISLPTVSPPSSLPIDCSPQPPSAAAFRLGLLQSQGISPMNFPACLQGQGRPKLNERQGASKIKRKEAVLDEDESAETSLIFAPKKRGHPIVIIKKNKFQLVNLPGVSGNCQNWQQNQHRILIFVTLAIFNG